MDVTDPARLLALLWDRKVPRQQLAKLLLAYPNLNAALADDPDNWGKHGLSRQAVIKLKSLTSAESRRRFESDSDRWQEKLIVWESSGIRPLVLGNCSYPTQLAEIPDAPALLFYKGNPDLFQLPLLAIVGSRRASEYGKRSARRFVRQLVGSGLATCSGLASGIDTQVHRSTLDAEGRTVAVLGTGVDVPYPKANRLLHQEIAQAGLLVSELVPGTGAAAHHFPERNRIISGLSRGVLVIEAAAKSGSLITARMALEQNRDVYAIPGTIDSVGHEGCHRLIQQGAKLVVNAGDILEELGVQQPSCRVRPTSETDLDGASGAPEFRQLEGIGGIDAKVAGEILRLVAVEPVRLEGLANAAGLSSDLLTSYLLELEMAGALRQNAGRYYLA
jgi:DNA processing protein